MTLSLRVANDKTSKDFIKETIIKYHSYVPSNSSVGRRIDWIVFNDDVPVGMIGIGSSVYPPPKDILTHTKLSMKEYKDNFNSFASNWRFCMREKIKNAGTQILKELRKMKFFNLINGFRGNSKVDLNMIMAEIFKIIKFHQEEKNKCYSIEINPAFVYKDTMIASDCVLSTG